MGSSKQDHSAVIARQVEQLRESLQVLEQDVPGCRRRCPGPHQGADVVSRER